MKIEIFMVMIMICGSCSALLLSPSAFPHSPDFSSLHIQIPSSVPSPLYNENSYITADEIYTTFTMTLHTSEDNQVQFLFMDITYHVTNITEYIRFLNDCHFAQKDEPEKDIYDCDDYAFKIYGLFCQKGWSGLPVGVIIWKNPKHADPFFVDEERTIWIVKDYNNVQKLTDYQQESYEAKMIII